MSPESEAYFTLNLLSGVGAVRVRKLRERLGSASAILKASRRDLEATEGIGPEIGKLIHQWREHGNPDDERRRAESRGIRIVTFADDDYPSALREIYDPPLVLYVWGTLPSPWPKGLAVVGTRHATHYGQETAKKLAYQIAYSGLPVVSGLARGVDTFAHQAALAAKGVTWAVLGGGLDKLYPPDNIPLAEKIAAERGAVISEFPLGLVPDKRTFPMRNRTVSGLSFGVLVVEAGAESGALITARQALEQGRQVFAVPGRIDNPQSRGCHQLIKEGATLVEGAGDVLAALEFLLPMREVTIERQRPVHLTAEEQTVFEAIEPEETPIDRIIQKSGLPSGSVSSTLLRLEMKKLVRQLPGKYFVRTA
jgi:DNA processing protein